MKKNNLLSAEDIDLFRTSVKGICQFKQDTIFHPPFRHTALEQEKRDLWTQIDECCYFSDNFQPHLNLEEPVRYLRSDIKKLELKKLRCGDYTPELFLDLHGLTKRQAKQAVAALIVACQYHQIPCACVIHGYGKHILKQQIPLWLAQHPRIQAFHQASRRWGGNAALLILIEVDQHAEQR